MFDDDSIIIYGLFQLLLFLYELSYLLNFAWVLRSILINKSHQRNIINRLPGFMYRLLFYFTLLKRRLFYWYHMYLFNLLNFTLLYILIICFWNLSILTIRILLMFLNILILLMFLNIWSFRFNLFILNIWILIIIFTIIWHNIIDLLFGFLIIITFNFFYFIIIHRI